MAAILQDGRLTLTGFVGDSYFDDGFTHGDVILALAQVDDASELEVVINSGGGYVDDGSAIYALLSRRQGTTNVVIDGIAASSASLIAMAGDTITMSAGALMMVHDPATITWGNSEAHAKGIEQLEAYATSFARIYAARTGKTVEACRAIMKAEKWMTADEAVSEGFADTAGEASARPVAAFDYRVYAHAPQRLVATANNKNWRLPDAKRPQASASALTGQPNGDSMTDKERADKLAAELDELKAQMAKDKDADASATMQAELETLRKEKEDRERTDAIMALDEAKGREELAKVLASNGMSVEGAKAALEKAPVAEVTEPTRMNGQGLGASAGQRPNGKAKASINTSEIYAARRAG